MVGHHYISHCDSEELWKAAQTPAHPLGWLLGLEWQVTEKWYFCQNAGEN